MAKPCLTTGIIRRRFLGVSSPEAKLVNMGLTQLARYYNLPNETAGMNITASPPMRLAG